MEEDRLRAVTPGESAPEPDDLEELLAPTDQLGESWLRTELHRTVGTAENLTLTPRIGPDSHGYAPNDTES